MTKGAEADRLREAYATDDGGGWLQWGPYLSERQWGTVREDYSEGGNAWDYLPHDHARSRTYRWGEDGLAGLSDDDQRLCFALALWNGTDPILKERLFGLTNSEGNHGEDVKEYYFYLDNTPTHSYLKWLYKYPQAAYPYDALVAENRRRKDSDPHAFEYELMDTGVFDGDRYFDVQVEYAKAAPQDILVRIQATNRGPDPATLHVLPTLWFRNTWSWSRDAARPSLSGQAANTAGGVATIRATRADDDDASPMVLRCQAPDALLFADNETNNARLFGVGNVTPWPKDGINDHVVNGRDSVNPSLNGTKAAASYVLTIGAGQTAEVRLRLSADGAVTAGGDPFGSDFEATFARRIADADEFYAAIGPHSLSDDRRAIQRQAYAGMLWSKQFYYYVVRDWLDGDPTQPTPPAGRGRNAGWRHFYARDILSMPDAWEYPWFAAWDLCFQSVVLARIDAEFAKEQLRILAREWYMSPDGAIPAYEWAFGDVNPPLHAWAALQIFEIDKEMNGGDGDGAFLAEIFRHCLLYFTWWLNRKDDDDNNLFQGGFLGLDNISVFDRSHLDGLADQLGRRLELYQSDGTSWMGMFTLQLMQTALALTRLGHDEYASLASKFFHHFVYIADAMNSIEERSQGQVRLWDEDDGFYYDIVRVEGNPDQYLTVELRSLVGVIALFPVAALDFADLERRTATRLQQRMAWFVAHHPELVDQVLTSKTGDVHLLTFVKPDRLTRILRRVLDESEFLSPHGIRGISRVHLDSPARLQLDGAALTAGYEPAESAMGLYGGNSNWRGPVWFPINFLLIHALRQYHEFLGDGFRVEHPTGSGRQCTLAQVADDLAGRLVAIFERDAGGRRAVYGGNSTFQEDPNWRDHLLFYEYFNGDNGAGVGASHQTGWTGLVAELLRG